MFEEALMKSYLLTIMLLFLAACCSTRSNEAAESPKNPSAKSGESPVWVSLVSTNDIHGYILPQTQHVKTRDQGYRDAGIGGMEWLAGYLDILNKRDPGRVLIMDAGDMFQGTLVSNNVRGASVVAAMNHIGYAAATIGNHDFDFGGETATDTDNFGAVRARAKQAKFPFLAANILDRKTGKVVAWDNVTDHVMVEIDGVKVAIIGGTTEDTPTVTPPYLGEELDVRPLAEVLVPLAAEMRKQGADVVVAVVHAGGRCKESGNPDDLSSCEQESEIFRFARAVPKGQIDVIFGGHTHSMVAHRVNGIPVIEAWAKGRDMGLVRVKVDRKAHKVMESRIEGPVPICHKLPSDSDTCIGLKGRRVSSKLVRATFLGKEVYSRPFLDGVLDDNMKAALLKGKELLGPTVLRPLRKGDVDNPGDNPLGVMLTDAMLHEYPGSDIAISNESGIRASLATGKVTYGDLFEMLPFDSTLMTIRMTGSELKDLLRITTSGAHSIPVIAGLRLKVDKSADECIAEDWNGNGKKEKFERKLLVSATLGDGSPIVDDNYYVVLTNSYLGNGGSDYIQVLKKLPKDRFAVPDQRTMRDVIADWMRKNPVELGGKDFPLGFGEKPRVQVLNPGHVPGESCAHALQ